MKQLSGLGRRLLDGWPLIIILATCSLLSARETVSGSSNQQKYQDLPVRMSYSLKDCRDIDSYRWSCNNVVFDPQIAKGKETNLRLR